MSFFKRLERFEESSRFEVFELAQAINDRFSKGTPSHEGFSGAHARAAGHYVCVRYHHDQEPSYLSIHVARRYLAWIRVGHVGTHRYMED